KEIFRSLAKLRSLVTIENKLITDLDTHIQVFREFIGTRDAKNLQQDIILVSLRINTLESRLVHAKTAMIAVTDDAHVTHPIHAFHMLKRYVKFWKTLTDDIDSIIVQDLHTFLTKYDDQLPDESDFSGACLAILRLQLTYEISTRDMADGKFIQKTKPDIPPSGMSVDDCYLIGYEAYKANDTHYCVKWMEEGLRRYKEGYSIMPWESSSEIAMLQLKTECLYKADMFNKAWSHFQELSMLDPKNDYVLKNRTTFEAIANTTNNETERLYPPRTVKFKDFNDCCNGKVNHKGNSGLVCYLKHYPTLGFRAFGEEVLHIHPRLVLIHGVIDDHEIDQLKSVAVPKLRASTTSTKSKGSRITPSRVSNTAWLEETDDNILLPRISRRLEAITGLNTENAEPYQLVNYGIGGHFIPHMDVNNANDTIKARVATLLIYLTDVQYGGSTVFDVLGVKVDARKGDAAFWFNLKKSGEFDKDSGHGSCPVLLGEKWIINKWFNYYDQFSKRKCGMSEDE
ncbi:prolyl 4-hydroxylase subunit alpha-2-like, partial [Saccoglossus kowalevskii]